MLDSTSSQNRLSPEPKDWQPNPAGGLFQSAISYQSNPQLALANQTLIFENAPSINKEMMGKGIALVELADGRIFYFQSSMAVMMAGGPLDSLLMELTRLPHWILSWKGAAEKVGFSIGAPLEFVDDDPRDLDSWNIQGWTQHAASKLATNGKNHSIQQIRTIVSEAENEIHAALSDRLKNFMSVLNQSMQDTYGHLHCSWQSAYNYLNPKDDKLRLYRRQADQTFPLFVQHLFLCPKDKQTALTIKAIDDGVPLIDFLASLLDCPRKIISHLKFLSIEDIGLQWDGRIKELVKILADLDVNRLPKSEREWGVFAETINLLPKITKLPITSASSRMLLRELSRNNWKKRFDISPSFEERALGIELFADDVQQAIVATVLNNGGEVSQHGGKVRRLATEVLCSLGLPRLENLSRKWRATKIRIDSMSRKLSQDGYPVILDKPLEFGELKVVQLINSSQLDSEGKRMSNCVGTYSGPCSRGEAFIFSIRDKSGASCVTIEYQLGLSSKGVPEIILVQQNGFGNQTPNRKYHDVLQLFDRYIKSPQNRARLLNIFIYQKSAGREESVWATKHLRSLEFIKFLECEAAGRFDFSKLAQAAVS